MNPAVRLIAIAGPPFVDSDSIVGACLAAEAGGVTAVQVRLKDQPASAIQRSTERLVKELSIPVYVNDRADVALVAGAQGVHVGADDISPMAVRRLAPRPFLIGVSVGDRREAAVALDADVDYWSIGSIFATGSKADAGSPIGTVGFRDLARLAPAGIPVIGIGGIDASNAAEVFGSGAQGIAVISAIFGAGNFEKAARRLRAIVDQASEAPTRPPGGAPL